jgi:ATP-dependent helicase/nuclease subunit A
VGYLRVAEKRSEQRGASRLLARPSEWPAKEAAEARFEAAEEVRLLYVAATRARDELVVSRWPAKAKSSPWAPLDGWIQENGQELVLDVGSPAPRGELQPDPSELGRRVDSAARALAALAEPSFRHVSVTDVAKGGAEERPARPRDEAPAGVEARFRGYSWGSAVHGALAAAATDDSEVGLRAACRALLVEHGRPLDDHG